MMRKIIPFIVSLLTFCTVLAQDVKTSKVFELNKYSHDFGIVNQVDGVINYTFSLINKSNSNVRIIDVVPECSCTEPTWSQDIIITDSEGTISVGFKADHYPGEFEKMVDVYTSLDTFQLKIMGKVLPKPLSDIEKEFPVSSGKIRFMDDVLGLKTVFDNKIFEKEFILYNDSIGPLLNLSFTNLPDYIQIKLQDSIPAKSQSKFQISYNPMLLNDYGHISDYIELQNNGKTHDFVIMANVTPFIPNYTERELILAPRISVDSGRTLKLGALETGVIHSREVTIRNNGSEDLRILKVKPACSCITSDIEQELTIKPSQQKIITIYFDTNGRKGRTKKSVYFYSNDPALPAYVLKITAEVK